MLTLKIARVIKTMQITVEKSIVEHTWKLLPKEESYELFLNQISLYTLEEIANKFAGFGGVYAPLADRTKRHNAKLDDTDYNRRLLEYLKSVDYITSVLINGDSNKSRMGRQDWIDTATYKCVAVSFLITVLIPIPDMQTYEWRGARMLSLSCWKGKCFQCMWANMENVTIKYDWGKIQKHRFESFCYGPKTCKFKL